MHKKETNCNSTTRRRRRKKLEKYKRIIWMMHPSKNPTLMSSHISSWSFYSKWHKRYVNPAMLGAWWYMYTIINKYVCRGRPHMHANSQIYKIIRVQFHMHGFLYIFCLSLRHHCQWTLSPEPIHVFSCHIHMYIALKMFTFNSDACMNVAPSCPT